MSGLRLSSLARAALLVAIGAVSFAGEPDALRTERLPNGLRVSILPRPDDTVVATQLWYHVGSANEDDQTRGLAHLFEHLMFGATAHHGPLDYWKLHHDAGGYENAYTTPDETVYLSAIVPGDHVKVLELEADRMRNLVLERDSLENEKRIVAEELRLRTESDPMTRALVAVQEALLGEHPYAFDPGGTREDVASATVDACRAFYDAYYHPGNAHLVIVGPVESGLTLAAVRRLFGPIPAGGRSPADVPSLLGWSFPKEIVVREDLPPVETAIEAFALPPADSDDRAALLLLGELLGGGSVDPFEEELVRRRRKALDAGVEQLSFRRGGAIVFYSVSLPYRRKATAFRSMERVRRRLSELEWLTEESLAAAKRAIARRELAKSYFPELQAEAIGRAQWWQGDARLALGEAAGVQSVTREELARVYHAYLGGPDPVRIYLRPERVPWVVRLFGWIYPLVQR